MGSISTPCREYRGVRGPDGYGRINQGKVRPGRGRQQVLLHRWVMEQVTGPLPAGVNVLHHCDNPPCFRFDHLFLGTQADNVADMVAKGRARGGRLPGERNPHAYLTAETVRRIRQLRQDGWTQQRIADAVGTSRGNVGLILCGRNWSHLQ